MYAVRLVIWVLLAGLASAQPPLRFKAPQGIHAVDRAQPGAGAVKRRHAARRHWILQFSSAPTPAQFVELASRGARILSYVPDFAYAISAPDAAQFDDMAWTGQLQSDAKLSADLRLSPEDTANRYVLVEVYPDVEPGDARAIVLDQNLQIVDNPDVVEHQLLVYGGSDDIARLAGWDEVSYIFPAANDLIRGIPVHGCVGALTSLGTVGQSIPSFGDGWDGPGLGSANLNYAFINETPKVPADQVASEIARAFAEWSKYVKVTFTPGSNPNAPLTIGILFGSGDHGDAYPFVGLAVVAHTFYPFPVNPEPLAGDMHFNADQNWGIGMGTEVYSVALHEAGHALGLGHSDMPGAVMYPYYRMNTALTPDDIAAIQRLYAAQESASPALAINATPPPATTTSPSILIQGTASGGSGIIQVSWTTDRGFTGVAGGGANWTAGPIPLSTGVNTITLKAQDGTGASSEQVFAITRQVMLSSAPQLAILSPCSATCTTQSPSVSVSGTASDPSGIARVLWSSSTGSGGSAAGTTAWNTGPIALQTGANTLTITVYAQSGATAHQTLQIMLPALSTIPDRTPPGINILSPTLTTLTTSASSIAFSGTARDKAGVVLVTWTNSNGGSGTASGTTNWTIPSIPLLVGTNTITIRATNVNNSTAWRSVTVTRL